jgi:hypothetical protein
MKDKSDHDLDELLKGHLAACLDGQLGRSALAFRAQQSPRRLLGRRGLLAGAALAAGLVIAAMTWALLARQGTNGHRISPPHEVVMGSKIDTAPPMVQSTTWSPVTDDGLAVVDDQPVRRLRRQIVDQVEWYDARDGAMVTRRMPREQLILIGVQTD